MLLGYGDSAWVCKRLANIIAKKHGGDKWCAIQQHQPGWSLTSRLYTEEPLPDVVQVMWERSLCGVSSLIKWSVTPASHEGRLRKRNSSNTRLKLTDLDGCIRMKLFSLR